MNDVTTCNIALRLRKISKELPWKRAVVFPAGRDSKGRVTYSHLTFEQLEKESDAYARGLARIGIGRSIRTLLMVRPGLEFIALTFALFKIGAVPVLIDPGMGRARLLECIMRVAPEAFIGISLAHAARVLHKKSFRSVQSNVTIGRRWFWGGHTLHNLKIEDEIPFEITPARADEMAAILFTTGSTGPAKGVVYEHGMFDAQCNLIKETYHVTRDDIDLPTFPLFALFSVALGMTAVIPDMDPTRPAQVDPVKIIEAVQNQGCTFSFGSPTLWKRVVSYCIKHSTRLLSLKKVLMAGAPVPTPLHRDFRKILNPEAETHTPYGATESLPATDMTGSEILAGTETSTLLGKGVCVGRPVHTVKVEIIRLTDEAIETWDDSLILPTGKIGEIAVAGPSVTKKYFNREEQTRLAKIHDEKRLWHRIGDLGYKDSKGRVWVCGRKSHRVETQHGILLTICCESIFNSHPAVSRSALVGIGKRPGQVPVIVIELENKKVGKNKLEILKKELLKLGDENEMTREIKKILFHPSFPVDIRHNAKIFREKLSVWAAHELEDEK